MEVAEVSGDPHIADHGPADHRHLAARLVRGVEDLLDPVHMGGEAGDDDPALCVPKDLVDGRGNLPLGRDETGHFGIRGVGDEEVDALLPQAREGAQVGEAAVQRELVHLEVAGMQHRPAGGVHRHGEGIRDGVVDRDELAVKDAEPLAGAFTDGQGVWRDPVLFELGFDQGQGQVGADERDVVLEAQQIGHAADVVLVAVGEHDGLDVVEAVGDGREVRQDQVDAGVVLVGEEDTAVDDEQLTGMLDDRHIAADFAEAPEGQDADGALGERTGRGEVGMRVDHARSVCASAARSFSRSAGGPST